jgi:hypothetical protein
MPESELAFEGRMRFYASATLVLMILPWTAVVKDTLDWVGPALTRSASLPDLLRADAPCVIFHAVKPEDEASGPVPILIQKFRKGWHVSA